MIDVALAEINNFPRDIAGNHESLLTITLGQLQDLINKAVEKAVAPLQQRIDRLEALQEVYHGPAPNVEELPLYREVYEKQRVAITSLPARVGAIEEDLTALEKTAGTAAKPKDVKPTQKTLDHLDHIAAILGNREQMLINSEAPRSYISQLRREGLTFRNLAGIMNLTVDRIRQLSRIAAADQRFNITWHPRRKNTKIITLRRWSTQNLGTV